MTYNCKNQQNPITKPVEIPTCVFDGTNGWVLVIFFQPNFQDIIFTQWFSDHLKKWHFWGRTPYAKCLPPSHLLLRIQSNLCPPPPNVWRGGKEGLKEGGGDSGNLPWLSWLHLGDLRCVSCWGGSCHKRDAVTHTALVALGFTLCTNYFVYSTIGT